MGGAIKKTSKVSSNFLPPQKSTYVFTERLHGFLFSIGRALGS